jgi:LytS/YehU family sensor histidine kinase
MNELGAWSLRPANYSFTIPLHFTRTWAFRATVLLIILTILWLTIRYYLNQRRIRERITSDRLLAELNALRSQMKPHFIFNSLNSVQHFIIENDEESAHLYLSRFSELMRKILEHTQKNTISLGREIETLELYLSLEKLRFGINFDYDIAIASGIIPDAVEIPPMLIQPYVENAIWHGLLPKKENAKLWLRFFSENNQLVCEIEDNGIGREKAREIKRKREHQSAGMKNIEERITIINRVSEIKVKLEVIDLHDAKGTALGTKVRLKFNNVFEKMQSDENRNC